MPGESFVFKQINLRQIRRLCRTEEKSGAQILLR
jgi:hypothetical protein